MRAMETELLTASMGMGLWRERFANSRAMAEFDIDIELPMSLPLRRTSGTPDGRERFPQVTESGRTIKPPVERSQKDIREIINL
jgi:hypothetical protein